MKNPVRKLIEEGKDFLIFASKLRDTANFEVALTNNIHQRDAVILCIGYAFMAGRESVKEIIGEEK